MNFQFKPRHLDQSFCNLVSLLTLISLVIQLNQQILRGYNHAFEIAMYIDFLLAKSPIDEDLMIQVLSYSSDKDRLELELRKLLITRLIEGEKFS